MSRIKVVADDKIPFLRGVLEPYAEMSYRPGAAIGPDDVRTADALIIRTRTTCNAALLDHSSIRFIATATIGFDHIDRDYCARRGIVWTSAPGCNSGSVQQYLASALLNLAAKRSFTLAGKTLGVIGVGHVGSKVAAAAAALGMTVLCCDPPRQRREGDTGFVTAAELLARADVVTVHVPLDPDGEPPTRHLIDAEFLRQLRPGAFVINSSRGEVVATAALQEALKSGRLGGAVLDVWENEPDIDRELLQLVDFATPHIAGYSADGKANGTSAGVRALSRFFGLGLDNWQVPDIPAPAAALLPPSPGLSGEAEWRRAVNHCYDIADDDRALRAAPDNFEKLRGNYRFRREFSAFTATGSPEAATLARLGFQVEQTTAAGQSSGRMI
ncbi:MAG: 4-phosphoerythronate dehydrogenase [Victivallales bacterium]|nr:4-phosphoerythronate dehydrogenase [Victivallales bacterium]